MVIAITHIATLLHTFNNYSVNFVAVATTNDQMIFCSKPNLVVTVYVPTYIWLKWQSNKQAKQTDQLTR